LNGVTLEETFADPQGAFSFRNLTPGSYSLRIDQSGFNPIRETIRVPFPSTLQVRLQPANIEKVEAADGRYTVDLSELKLPKKALSEYSKGIRARYEGNLQHSIEHLERAIRLAPEYYRAHLALAEAYGKVGRIGDSEVEFRNASTLSPRDAEPFVKLGELNLRIEEFNKAAEAFKEASLRSPASGRIAFQLGFALFRLNQLSEAESSLLLAQQLQPNETGISLLLIKVLVKQQKFKEALAQQEILQSLRRRSNSGRR
jgi:Flp pilus assembly protein TadD